MKRWLLWNLRCLRGRRCARLEYTVTEVPVGVQLMVEWTCANCGTKYLTNGKEVIRLG